MSFHLTARGAAFLLLCAILVQCSDPHERYEDPPWLGGTNIETLEEAGNYNHFLALMDKAEYRVSIENQLFTLFVPNDSAFEAYFKTIGINSVDEMSRDQAEELFGQHILINPRSREQLMYEYAWEELQDDEGEYGTLFLRKETYSVPRDYSEEVRYNPQFAGQTLKLYRDNTLLPLFTTEYFEDYFGDPSGSDYLFMYPNSSWSGTQWHDAMVTEAEVRSSSGFIYYIDRVVAPIPTIDKYVYENQDRFGLFFDLAQRFATYGDPSVNEQLERRYKKSYSQILDIADESGPSTGNPANMLYMFTAFLPYDDVLQEYLDNTVLQYNETIDDVPELYLVYLLQSHLNSILNLPSKMQSRFLNYYGDRIDIDVYEDIQEVKMCSNGVIYGMNRILEPNAFSCVPGPLFYTNDYTTLLTALQSSGLLTTIAQPDIDVTLFAPKNADMLAFGIRQNTNADGVVYIEIRSSDGNWNEITNSDLQELVRGFIHFGKIENLEGEGFIRMASDNYVYYNDNALYGGGNQVSGSPANATEKITSEQNGNLYYIENTIQKPLNVAERMMADPDLSSFVDLMDEAGLIDSVQVDYEQEGVEQPRVIFISELKQWTIFAPTNQAIADAELAGLIPTEQEALRNFIYYHFMRGKTVFDDGKVSGTFSTNKIDKIVGSEIQYATLTLTNGVNNLGVQDMSGQSITVDHANANSLVEYGVVHKIDNVLQFN